MNFSKLVENVEQKLPKSAKHVKGSSLIHKAIFETLENPPPSASDDALYARAAQRAVELDREEKSAQIGQTATDRVFGDALVRALASRIEELRREEFGSVDPPFKNVVEAAQWVEQTSNADLTNYRE